jgi:hypothetical protein
MPIVAKAAPGGDRGYVIRIRDIMEYTLGTPENRLKNLVYLRNEWVVGIAALRAFSLIFPI